MSMAIRIAFLQICIFGSLAFLLSLGIYDVSILNPVDNGQSISGPTNADLPTVASYTATAILNYVFGVFLRVFKPFVDIITWTAFPTTTFHTLGINNGFIDLLGAMCTLIYGVAVVEFIGNRKVTP